MVLLLEFLLQDFFTFLSVISVGHYKAEHILMLFFTPPISLFLAQNTLKTHFSTRL